jgi:hypothetical protein
MMKHYESTERSLTDVPTQPDVWTSAMRHVATESDQRLCNITVPVSCSDRRYVGSLIEVDALEVHHVDNKETIASPNSIGNVAVLFGIIQLNSQHEKKLKENSRLRCEQRLVHCSSSRF